MHLLLSPILFLACSNAGLYPEPDKTGDGDDSGPGDSGTVDDSGAGDDSGTSEDARPPVAGDLLISELMIDPASGEDDQQEWVELHNTSADPLTLEGVALLDEDGDGVTLHGLVIAGRGWLLLAAGDVSAETGAAPEMIYDADLFHLGNGDGAVSVQLDGVILDALTYDDVSWPILEGRALSRIDPEGSPEAGDAPGAWCAADSAMPGGDYGTPDAAPGACYTAPVNDDEDGDGWTVAEGDCDDTDNDTSPEAPEVGGADGDGIDNDCDGLIDEAPPLREEVVINEIMKNPDPTDDDYGEWFEIATVVDHPLELGGMVVEDADGGTFTLPEVTLMPGGFLVIAASDVGTDNGGLAPDLVWPAGSFHLGNDSDTILLTLDSEEIDEVAYDNGFPDDSGVALSLDPDHIDADDNDDQDNWCNAGDAYGTDGNLGTPGDANPEC